MLFRSRPVVSLGREGSNTIQLHDSEVSRNHAEVRRQDNAYLLVDLESSNGTFVNSETITERTLQSGDRVQIGRTLMIFTQTEDSSSIDLAEDVDIVGVDRASQGSRIVKAISHEEGSNFLHDVERSEEHTSELQSRRNLVCRLLLEKKKIKKQIIPYKPVPSANMLSVH